MHRLSRIGAVYYGRVIPVFGGSAHSQKCVEMPVFVGAVNVQLYAQV